MADPPRRSRRRGATALAAVLAGLVLPAGCSAGDGSGGRSWEVPDPASVPAPVWEAGTRSGNPLAAFEDTPDNTDDAEAPTVVPAPNAPGLRAIRFEVPGGGKRTELEPRFRDLREGDELWFGFAHYLPPEFPVATEGWQVVAQWKNSDEGSPPLEIKIGNGRFFLDDARIARSYESAAALAGG